MSDKKLAFWYSQLHAEHYREMNKFPMINVVTKRPDLIRMNQVIIDGKKVIYTACTNDLHAKEPFENALKTFPDYALLGISSRRLIGTIGIW